MLVLGSGAAIMSRCIIFRKRKTPSFLTMHMLCFEKILLVSACLQKFNTICFLLILFVQYSSMGNEGPAVLLVHGFGAFWEHYRDNLKGLAAKGYRVWALTLVGFGRSEKPQITYTELTWAELVRDFIVEVVQEPVVLAGNSIGGEMIVLLHLSLSPRDFGYLPDIFEIFSPRLSNIFQSYTPFGCRLHNHRSGWLVAIVSNIISIAQHCWESGP